MSPTKLLIPRATRLEVVWHVGNGIWQLWTACPDRNASFDSMLGTCLMVYPSGKAERVTTRPDGTTQIMEIMPDD